MSSLTFLFSHAFHFRTFLFYRASWHSVKCHKLLKGQSNEIFDPSFFRHSNLHGLTNGLEYFSILVKISQSYSIFSNIPAVSYTAQSQSPRSIILRGVMGLFSILFNGTFQRDLLPVTEQWVKNVQFCSRFRRVIRFFRDWLSAVSPKHDTKIRLTERNLNQNRKYCNPLVRGPGRFEGWKKLEVENLVGLSLLS